VSILSRVLVASAALLAACGACSRRAEEPPTLTVTVAGGAISAPDSVRASWTRLRVEEDGQGHLVELFRIPGELPDAAVAALRAAMDTAHATPRGMVAVGSPEVGDTGEVVLRLTPGRYLLGCVRRGTDGHRHLAGGEWKTIDVIAGDADAREPVATQEVGMGDFAFSGPGAWRPGRQMVAVVNRGRQDHQLRIDRLHPGVTLQSWLAAAETASVSTPVAGAARMGPGLTVYLPLTLERGEYVFYCLIPDPASGKPHVMLGMVRGLKVE